MIEKTAIDYIKYLLSISFRNIVPEMMFISKCISGYFLWNDEDKCNEFISELGIDQDVHVKRKTYHNGGEGYSMYARCDFAINTLAEKVCEKLNRMYFSSQVEFYGYIENLIPFCEIKKWYDLKKDMTNKIIEMLEYDEVKNGH